MKRLPCFSRDEKASPEAKRERERRRGKADVLGSRDERSHVLRETGQQAEINRGQDTDNQQDRWKDRHGTQEERETEG